MSTMAIASFLALPHRSVSYEPLKPTCWWPGPAPLPLPAHCRPGTPEGVKRVNQGTLGPAAGRQEWWPCPGAAPSPCSPRHTVPPPWMQAARGSVLHVLHRADGLGRFVTSPTLRLGCTFTNSRDRRLPIRSNIPSPHLCSCWGLGPSAPGISHAGFRGGGIGV